MTIRSRFSPRRYREAWRALRPFLGASNRRVIALAGASLVRGLAEAAVLVLVARVALALADGDSQVLFGLGPLGDRRASIGQVLGAAILLAAAMLGLFLLIAHLTAKMQADAMLAARTRLSSSFLVASWDVQSIEREGQLQEVMTTYVARVAQGAVLIATGLSAGLSLLALTAGAIAVDALAALTMVVAVITFALALRPMNRLSRRLGEQNRVANTEFATSVTEAAGVAQEIATFNVGMAVSARLRWQAQRAAATQQKVGFVNRSVGGVYQSLGVFVIIGGLAVLNVAGTANVASLGAVVLLLVRAMAYGRQVQSVTTGLNEVLPYLRRARAQEADYRRARRTAGDRRLSSIESVDFVRAGYHYGDDVPAVEGVSLTIERGDVIGVVGPSGSGKSTLIQLLLRLRMPTEGEYRINGRPAEDFDLQDWYRLLAVVPQQPRLFEGTAADNIRFFRDDISDEAVRAAARQAHVHDAIEQWPDGYDTVLRGMGSGVSGGQAQRLCIARALAAEPELLVLDEPTSALDTHSEALIQEALQQLKGRTTMVVIAHRLSTLRQCDRIVVLDGGRVQGCDTPEALQRDNVYYREALELSRSA